MGEGCSSATFLDSSCHSDGLGQGAGACLRDQAPQMTLMLEIQAPLFENASGFLHPNLLKRFLELKNVWSGIFKGYFDVEIQSYMGANF